MSSGFIKIRFILFVPLLDSTFNCSWNHFLLFKETHFSKAYFSKSQLGMDIKMMSIKSAYL